MDFDKYINMIPRNMVVDYAEPIKNTDIKGFFFMSACFNKALITDKHNTPIGRLMAQSIKIHLKKERYFNKHNQLVEG